MDIFQEDIQTLCNAFNKVKLRYILIGGFAVNYHGYPRSTGDLDLWIDPSEDNKKKLLLALNDLNYDIEELSNISLAGATYS